MAQLHDPSDLPQTVDEAAIDIISGMDLKDRSYLENLSEEDLIPLQFTLGLYIDQQLQAWSINKSLNESCIKAYREEELDEPNPSAVIIKRIWERLKKTHKLKVVD